ncbi:DoxX family protein [Ktedonosporobacter rubrisoli]|uniref:DoxX family protein n=1 Tax=Ktedonosporobacter rubrisoli TaxID=2509675 RepID=A0A4P6JK43_KTERU|nr:DoxX family protein [Ktedonosporobacter rubrisoli]QBD75518.1 DoxX family protein [Ktedonosporobacter rubrisoli]
MQLTTHAAPNTKTGLWIGRALSALAILFLLFDGITHVMQVSAVAESMQQLGYPVSLALSLGIIELACIVLYMFRPTSFLGAILLTGYLGGAIASHLRLGDPLFSHVLFPVYLGILIWSGLYLRSERLRALFSWQR